MTLPTEANAGAHYNAEERGQVFHLTLEDVNRGGFLQHQHADPIFLLSLHIIGVPGQRQENVDVLTVSNARNDLRSTQ
ncbi:MAG: hypothetical protein FRX48_04671 [Lasallia pustulata]|uniref:Uncharacterized protein n=1 Tax=Lasallia pustulata TaxID=136370 RepID=A0A5M8PS17_9LECA|nr:MAG: hypothetical protein FRX48_04671 [Lasallia pustulata]